MKHLAAIGFGYTAQALADHLDRGVSHAQSGAGQERIYVPEHVSATDPTPFGQVGSEHLAEVAHAGRRQQRITQRVRGNIAI